MSEGPQFHQQPQYPLGYHSRVLLVDDQAIVADVLRRALDGQPDINMEYCSDPREALSMTTQCHPTVILLDLVMPGLDGLTLLQKYRNNPLTSETPIVVLSARDEADIKAQAFAFGANDFLVKLPDPVEIRARVRYHSKAYLTRVQRDDAFRALRQSQQELLEKNQELVHANHELEVALAEVKQLHGLLPICSVCKKVRDDRNYWHQIEIYITQHTEARFSHGLCPDCAAREKQRIEERRRSMSPPEPQLPDLG
jgi:PleD family two-component response regulator